MVVDCCSLAITLQSIDYHSSLLMTGDRTSHNINRRRVLLVCQSHSCMQSTKQQHVLETKIGANYQVCEDSGVRCAVLDRKVVESQKFGVSFVMKWIHSNSLLHSNALISRRSARRRPPGVNLGF